MWPEYDIFHLAVVLLNEIKLLRHYRSASDWTLEIEVAALSRI
jgi:hypothetical protein